MMPDIVISQAQFFESPVCRDAIQKIEDRYSYGDESEYFGNLVNFSTSKTEPYQRWVRYREGYSTVLVHELLLRAGINPTSHYVADPMVGSGSTIIAAKKNGMDVFGLDVNPYCQLIVETKLLRPSEEDLQKVMSFLDSLPHSFDKCSAFEPPLSEYFPKENLISLLAIKNRIELLSESTARKILLACWYFIIEACSNRKKDGNGLATRPAPVHDVAEHFRNTVKDIVTDYAAAPFSADTKFAVYTGSACNFTEYNSRFASVSGKKLGAVIFSPPYANAFDYYESYKMELLFGQLYTPDDYQLHRKEQIRNYRISYGCQLSCEYPIVELLCKEINAAIPRKEKMTGKRDARTRLMPNMLCAYFTDMGKVLEQLYQSIDTSGHCYIVVDQSAYAGVIVPTDIVLADIADSIGFTVEKLIICRKAATSGQQRKAYPYLASTLRESIVCLKK